MGSLVITDTSPGSPHSVALSGTGEDFTVLSSPASASVAAGGSTTYQLTVAPAGGFNQAVNLGCTGAPAHSVCAINPNSLTLSGSGASTATVTVSTAASSEVAPRGPQTPSGLRPWEFRHGPLLVWLAVLAMLGLAGAKALRRYRGQSAEFAPLMPVRGFALGLMLLMALAWAACSTGGPVPVRLQGTPAGTYTITLTATDPQANNLSHSATVTLTVTQ